MLWSWELETRLGGRQGEGKFILLCAVRPHNHSENKVFVCYGLPTAGCTGREEKTEVTQSLKAEFFISSSEVSGPRVGGRLGNSFQRGQHFVLPLGTLKISVIQKV